MAVTCLRGLCKQGVVNVLSLMYIKEADAQHGGGKPVQAEGTDGMQLFVVDCIIYIVDADRDDFC